MASRPNPPRRHAAPRAARTTQSLFEARETARLALAEARERRRITINTPRGAVLPPLAERLGGLS
jgi:hypothetical protein